MLEEKIAAAHTMAGVKYHFVSLKMDSTVRFQRTSTESKWRSLKGGDKKGKEALCICLCVSVCVCLETALEQIYSLAACCI